MPEEPDEVRYLHDLLVERGDLEITGVNLRGERIMKLTEQGQKKVAELERGRHARA